MKKSQKKTLLNFKKAQSHLAKVIKMIKDGEYCIDIMQQNLAVIGLLKSAHQMIMEGHLNSCFKKAMASKDERKQKTMINEILRVTSLVNR